MSQLDPQTNTALTQLLVELQSPDNGRRTVAEENLTAQWITARPGVLLMGLAEQMQAAQDSTTRSYSAVLFRRIASRNRKEENEESSQELFMSLGTGACEAIRTKLLEALGSESDVQVRHKIGDAVADIARQYTDEDITWPGMLGALFAASQSNDSGQRETAFRIFATTPDIIEKEHQDAVLGAFQKGFKDDDIRVCSSSVTYDAND